MKHIDMITTAAESVCKSLSGVDYLENNFRVLLSRHLRKNGYEVYEEIVIPYILDTDNIPFGHGYADIVLLTPDGSIIIELKTIKKNCSRQLKKYMKNWKYNSLYGGITINFVNDEFLIHSYISE